MDDLNFEDFEQYLVQGEPDKKKKTYAWQTAIGLQAVDNLKPSAYLIETAKKNIEGEIISLLFLKRGTVSGMSDRMF